MDDLQAFQNFKEAFDHFDWNNTKTIATSVSIEIHISHLKIIVVQMLDLVSKRHSIIIEEYCVGAEEGGLQSHRAADDGRYQQGGRWLRQRLLRQLHNHHPGARQ